MITISTEHIRRAQKGDRAALERLYEAYRTPLFRYLYYRLGDLDAAERLTGQALIKALGELAESRGRRVDFPRRLFRLAGELVQAQPGGAAPAPDGPLGGAPQAEAPGEGDEALLAGEKGLTRQGVWRALARLPEEQREALILRLLAEMPLAEAAGALGQSQAEVKAVQRQALISLHKLLSSREAEHA